MKINKYYSIILYIYSVTHLGELDSNPEIP